MEYTKKQILENKVLLKEDALENALMVAGFVPVIGEVADIALILLYISRKEYLYAGLMLIALIPFVGDWVAKPFIRLLKGSGSAGRIALKSSDDMVKFLSTNPKAQQQYVKIGEHLSNPAITKTINGIEKVPGVGTKMASGLRKSIAEHTSVLGRLKPVRLGKTITKDVAAGGKLSTSYKQFFRGEALSKYVAKKGMEPKTWLGNWWNVVRAGRKDRRNMVKYFVMSSNILKMFGLPDYESFEEKMSNDPEFRTKMANDPKFSNMISNSVSPEELRTIEGGSGGSLNSGESLASSGMSLGMLKSLAQMAF
jgi:hypothetical protein